MPDSNRDEIEKLEKLYASNPAGRVFTHLAEAYRKDGDLDRAGELLEAGLLQHPDYPSAWVVMGRVRLDRGDKDEAASAFRRVLELDRHNLIAIRALGDLALEAGEFEAARHYLGELIQIDPADLETAERLEQLPPEAGPEALQAELEPYDEEAVAAPSEAADTPVVEDIGSTEVMADAAHEPDGVPSGDAAWGDVTLGRGSPDAGTIDADTPPESGPAEESTAAEELGVEDQSASREAGTPAHGSAPLDAWVESLHILDPGVDLPEVTGMAAEEAEIGSMSGLDTDSTREPESVAAEAVGSPGQAVDRDGGLMDLDQEAREMEPGAPEPEPVAGAELGAGREAAEGLEPAVERAIAAAPEAEPEAVEEEVEAPADSESPSDPEVTWLGDPEIHAKVPDPVEWVSQEDWERIAAYGAWTGTGETEQDVESVPPIEPEWSGSDRDEDADEVATETLAEVYAAQGFRAEAIEIYRKLLRRRPEDPRLLSRLSALEAEREEPVLEEAGFEAAEEAGAAAAGQVWLEKIESTWPGGEEQAVAGPTPYAWIESGAAEPESGETIGDRLRELLAWRPESVPEPEPTLLLEEVADDPVLPDLPSFGTAATASADRPDAETDDLEMFRSWLKSLRK